MDSSISSNSSNSSTKSVLSKSLSSEAEDKQSQSVKINQWYQDNVMPPKVNLKSISSLRRRSRITQATLGQEETNHGTSIATGTYSKHLSIAQTEKKKEVIITKSLHFILMELPTYILQLDVLLGEIATVVGKCEQDFQSKCSNKDYKGQQETLLARVAEKMKTSDDNKGKPKNVSEDNLQDVCSQHHLQAGHHCFDAYNLQKTLDRTNFQTIPSNVDILNFGNKLRTIFSKLSKHFWQVELGFSLLFPKSESNDDANKSIQVLEQLLAQANKVSLDMNLFERWSRHRAELVETWLSHPHFGDAWYLLTKFDLDCARKFETLIRQLITQYLIFYDIFVMNIDSIVDAKKKNTRVRSKRTSSASEHNSPSPTSPNQYNSFFS